MKRRLKNRKSDDEGNFKKTDILIQQRAAFGFRRSCSGFRGGGAGLGVLEFSKISPPLLRKT